MKKITSIFLALLCFCMLNSCVKEIDGLLTTKSVCDSSLHLSQPYDYSRIMNKNSWKELNTTEDMFRVCQIPIDTLKHMTTLAIIKTCINHPLAFLYTAYNNELDGLDIIVNNSNAFQELLTRDNATFELINLYSNAIVQSDYELLNYKMMTNENELSIVSLNLIELLLGSGYLPKQSVIDNKNELNYAISKWNLEKNRNPDVYSEYSVSKNRFIMDVLNNVKHYSKSFSYSIYKSIEQPLSKTKAWGDFINYVPLYTTYGQLVVGYTRTDMTDSEKANIVAQHTRAYPNAVIIGQPTPTYNCHSYAWNISDNGCICWIDNTSSSCLYRYWTNDKYCLSPFSFMGVKILYYNSDHSAIKDGTSVMYISKWGAGPLMRHDPSYGPYLNMNQRHYYRSISSTDILEGNSLTTVGTPNIYSAAITDSDRFTFEWIIENAKGDSVGFTHSINYYRDTITFTKAGLYTITCNIYFNNEYVGNQWLEVAVEL